MKMPGGSLGVGPGQGREFWRWECRWQHYIQVFLLTVFSWILYCWALSEVAQTGTELAEKKGLIYTSGQAFHLTKAIPDLKERGGGVGYPGVGKLRGWGRGAPCR